MNKRKVKKPVCLIILDGWGLSDKKNGNAIHLAKTSNMDKYYKIYPNTKLDASGEAVGLPDCQMGNSEVGHLNIGAGRVVYQEYTRINKAIEDGSFFKNELFDKAIEKANENNGSLHLMGLVSDGGVHSHINHLEALIKLAKEKNVKNLYIHAFLDGRDVPPRSAIPYLKEVNDILKENDNIGELATVSGRYYAMDRDNRWDRTKKAYDDLVYRQGEEFESAEQLVENSYNNDTDDEFVIPAKVKVKDSEKAKVKDGDSIIFFNFRPDRARQLTRAFISGDFDKFDRGENPPEVFFICMTQYDKTFDAPIAFPPNKIKNTLGEVLAAHSLRQLRIAETEKYAHVTFFFNGGVEKPNEGEDRILIPSPKVATYNLKPEMSAYEVTDTVIKEIEKRLYDVIILNYANPDMVGHTGFLDAAVKAVEAVDQCLGRVVDKILEAGGIALVTADHGNAEEMYDFKNECTITKHTTSLVPFILTDENLKGFKKREKKCMLCDIAPTILDLLNIDKPGEMTGKSLIPDNY